MNAHLPKRATSRWLSKIIGALTQARDWYGTLRDRQQRDRRNKEARIRFRARVRLGGKTATGTPVPAEVVESLGRVKRPPVCVTINGPHLPQHRGVCGWRVYRSVSSERPDRRRRLG